MGILKDEIGNTYSRLTVLGRAANKGTRACWLCQCSCGNTHIVTGKLLRSKEVRSCGCLHKDEVRERFLKHGHNTKNGPSPTYHSWAGMVSRCTYTKHVGYPNYGARGITVCERWTDFTRFLKDMGEKPHGFSISRIDHDKGYYPENCEWALRGTH